MSKIVHQNDGTLSMSFDLLCLSLATPPFVYIYKNRVYLLVEKTFGTIVQFPFMVPAATEIMIIPA